MTVEEEQRRIHIGETTKVLESAAVEFTGGDPPALMRAIAPAVTAWVDGLRARDLETIAEVRRTDEWNRGVAEKRRRELIASTAADLARLTDRERRYKAALGRATLRTFGKGDVGMFTCSAETIMSDQVDAPFPRAADQVDAPFPRAAALCPTGHDHRVTP